MWAVPESLRKSGPGVLSGFFLFWSLSAERQTGSDIPMPRGYRKKKMFFSKLGNPRAVV